MKKICALLISGLTVWLAIAAGARDSAAQARPSQGPDTPALGTRADRDPGRVTSLIRDEVRHQLVTLANYGVFDWIEGEVLADDTVVLRGEVTRPTLKDDAELRVGKLESVSKVKNEIEVLPLSPDDDNIRIRMYRAIFAYDSPLFQYATRAMPPIHIIVNNGRVTLKGVVATDMDSQLAYTAARNVSGVFEVKNELRVVNPSESN